MLAWVLAVCLVSATAAQDTVLRVGIYKNEPKLFVDANGTPKGFYPEILNAIAKTNGWTLKYVPCIWNACLEMVRSAELDVMPDVALLPARESLFKFGHETALYSWSNLYSKTPSVLRDWADLDGLNVAVVADSSQQQELRSLASRLRMAPHIIAEPTFPAVFEAVQQGRADVGIVNRFFGARFQQQYGLQRVNLPPFQPVSLFFVVPNGSDPHVIARIDATLAGLKADPGSVYYAAERRWLEPPSAERLPAWAYWLGGIFLAALFAGIGTIVVRDRRVLAAERKKADQRIHAAFENVTAGNVIFGADGIIQIFNSTAEKIFGYTAAEVEGRNVSVLLPEDDRFDADKFAQRFRSGGLETRTGPYWDATGLRKDGSRFPMQIGIAEMRIAHETSYVASINDMSEMRSLEAQLRQAQKMEVVGQLTGGLAHDLNNALGIVMLNIGMLSRLGADDPRAAKHADMVNKAIRRSSALTRKLLDFSRTEVREAKRVSVNEFISGIRPLVEKSLTPAIRLEMSLAEDVWLVDIDPGDLEDALLNMSINARDAMPDGGTLVIETSNKVLDENYVRSNPGTSAGEFVMIAISDTGTGMPPEVVEKAFEPFFTTKAAGKGTGLGLSMVYGFVHRSGGHVKIYTEEDEGTTIRLFLPRARGDAETAEAEAATRADLPGGTERILVVDDEEDLRNAAVEVLTSLGYATVAATSGQQALEILDRDPAIDLVFCDVIMPGGMDGYHLAVEAMEKHRRVKILLTSGFSAKREELSGNPRQVAADLARGLLQKPDGAAELVTTILQKPYNAAELANAVRRTLDQQTQTP